jgi:hypothetical protein
MVDGVFYELALLIAERSRKRRRFGCRWAELDRYRPSTDGCKLADSCKLSRQAREFVAPSRPDLRPDPPRFENRDSGFPEVV